VKQIAPQVIQVDVRSVVAPDAEAAALVAEKLAKQRMAQALAEVKMGLQRLLDEAGLRQVCSSLGLEYDTLPGESFPQKAASLVAQFHEGDRPYELMLSMYKLLLQRSSEGIPERYRAQMRRVAAMSVQELKDEMTPKLNASFACAYTYSVYGSGDVLVNVHVVPASDLPPLPRIGLTMTVPAGYEQFAWYGRGPHESYVDRKEGARVGAYSSTVDEQYVPYVVPEENGNKTDVRWVALTDQQGDGLLVVGQPLLEVSAHHFTAQDLTNANHTHELVRRDEITLNLDHRQTGLGGASCGPGTLDKYLLWPEEMRFGLRLRPLSGSGAPAMSLARQILERVCQI
jgi:hypothetical protein